jgi:hypothetical protein
LERSQLAIDTIEHFVPIDEVASFCGIPTFVNLLPDFVFAKDQVLISLLEQPEGLVIYARCHAPSRFSEFFMVPVT